MKKILLFSIFLIMIIFTPGCVLNSNTDVIQTLEQKIATYNYELAQYEKKTYQLGVDETNTTEGGILELYYNNGEKKVAKLHLFGEMGKLVLTYYIENNNIIAYKKEEFSYNVPIYIGGSKVQAGTLSKYYFVGNRLVAFSRNDKLITDRKRVEAINTADDVRLYTTIVETKV